MTRQEKAKELVDKFDGNKNYALIAVDEILNTLRRLYSLHITIDENPPTNYWQEVKEEINKP